MNKIKFLAVCLSVLFIGVFVRSVIIEIKTTAKTNKQNISAVKTPSVTTKVNVTSKTPALSIYGEETDLALKTAQGSQQVSSDLNIGPTLRQTGKAGRTSSVTLSAQAKTTTVTPSVSTGVTQTEQIAKTSSAGTGGGETKAARKASAAGSGGKEIASAAKGSGIGQEKTLDMAPADTTPKGKTKTEIDTSIVTPVKAETNQTKAQTSTPADTSKKESTTTATTQPTTTVNEPTITQTETKGKNVKSIPQSIPQTESALRFLYVDGLNGSDTIGTGSSAKPWKTIKYAVNKLVPGDTLSIMGGIYKERITIKKSGTPENQIIIGSFGNGEVIIDASPEIGAWTAYTETTIKGIYKTTCSFKPTAVVLNEKPIFPAFVLADIKEGEWYYDTLKTTLYLYPNAGVKPTQDNVGVVSNNEYQDGVNINQGSYITLYGLTIRYAGGRGITILGNYNEVINCNVKFNGHTGINIWHNSTIKSTDTLVSGNNIYHNFLKNWPRGRYKTGGWGGGAISHGTPNTKFIGNISHKNGGEGLLAYGGDGGTVWRDNIVYDNWSVNIYIDNQPNGIIDGNTVFSSEPDIHDLYHNGDAHPGDNSNLKRLRPEGIMTADEDYKRTPPANLNNVKITNNIISGCRRAINHNAGALGSGLKNVFVSNNTIVVPNAIGTGENFRGIRIPYNKGNNINVVFKDNVIYGNNPSTYLLWIETNPLISGVDPQSLDVLTFKGNTWYHANRSKAFHVGPTNKTTYDVDFNGWRNICKDNCIADVYKNITTLIQPILDRITSIKATYK